MPSYATRQDFFTLGLPAAACTPASRTLSSVLVTDSAFELPGHGYGGGELLRFVAIGEGATLPGGLGASSLYEVDVLGSDLFRVKLGGSAVPISSGGVGVIAVVEDVASAIDAILATCSSYLDAHAKAYSPPFRAPYPKWATRTVCKLAALDVALVLRRSNPSYSLDDVKDEAAKAEAFLARLASGEPMADNPPDQTPGRPQAGARGWRHRPSSDWGNEGEGGAL